MGILKSFKINIYLLLLIAIFFRIELSLLPPFEYDQSLYRFWTKRLVELGPSNFYSDEVFTNNPLGFLYSFWIIGLLKKIFFTNIDFFSSEFDLLLKLPANIADILSGLIIFSIIKKSTGQKRALLGFGLYVFNPAIFFNSSIWGQNDGFATLFLLLAGYSILIRKLPELSSSFFALAWIVKPQTLAFTPLFSLIIVKLYPAVRWFASSLFFLITALIVYLPFFPNNPLAGLFYVNINSSQLFNCTSCFAFNFWGMFGNWNNDLNQFLGIPLVIWGVILLSIFLLPFLFLKHSSLKQPYAYLTIAISIMAFFTLLTRMHERYIFSILPFLLLASLLLKSRTLIFFYILISFLSLINLYLPYAYYNQHLKLPSYLTNLLLSNFQLLSAIVVLTFLLLYMYYFKIIRDVKDK